MQASEKTAGEEPDLVQAIIEEKGDLVERILKGSFNPNQTNRFGDSPLIWATAKHKKDWVQKLLKAGADPNFHGSYGKTALHWAAAEGNASIMEVLIKGGAQVDNTDNEMRTPLMTAIKAKHQAAIDLLLKSGASVNRYDSQGVTVLMYAVESRRQQSVEMVILAGADLDARDKKNETAYTKALRHGMSRSFFTPLVLKKYPDMDARVKQGVETRIVNLDERPEWQLNRIEAEIHRLVNIERTAKKLDPLTYDAKLAEVAHFHSANMAEHRFFNHVDPQKRDATDRAQALGYKEHGPGKNGTVKSGIGENIYQGFEYASGSVTVSDGVRLEEREWITEKTIAKLAVEGWMNSPGHRANILNDHYEKQGIGVVLDGEGRVYITQNFW